MPSLREVPAEKQLWYPANAEPFDSEQLAGMRPDRPFLWIGQDACAGDVKLVEPGAAKGDHRRMADRNGDALDHASGRRDAGHRTAMDQRAPIVAFTVTRRAINAALDPRCGKEHASVGETAAVNIEIVNPNGFVAAIGEIHALIVRRKGYAIANDETAVDAVGGQIRIKSEQFSLASLKIGMHACTPIASAPIAFAIVEHQPRIGRERVRDRFDCAILENDSVKAGPHARDETTIFGENKGSDVGRQTNTRHSSGGWIEAADRRGEGIYPVKTLVPHAPAGRLAEQIDPLRRHGYGCHF